MTPRRIRSSILVALIGAGGLVGSALIPVMLARDDGADDATPGPTAAAEPPRDAGTDPSGTQGSTSVDGAEIEASVLRDGVTVDLTCDGLNLQMRGGDEIGLVYEITSSRDGAVGLGASLYEIGGDGEHWDAAHDLDLVEVHAGREPVSRPFVIPADVPPARYELVGEVWPGGEVGKEGADTLDDEVCGVVTIVD